MSAFDPDSFLNDTDTGALSTSFEPIPEDEYIAVIGSGEKSIVIRNTQKGSVIVDITWEILDDVLKEKLGRDTLTVRQSVFLDMTPNNTLDRGKGKNVQLGRVREAVGQNDPSVPWSIGNLKGAGPAKIRVSQRPSEDGSVIYNDVKAVTRLTT